VLSIVKSTAAQVAIAGFAKRCALKQAAAFPDPAI
jgi:hypothetical protein